MSCLFSQLADLCKTEKASIDECFIDFTLPVRDEILRRYPHLTHTPPSGADTPLPPPPGPISWGANSSLVPIRPKDDVTGNTDEPSASTHCDPELEEPPITWHDVALSIAADMMQSARDQVRTKLGYSTSAVCASTPSIPHKDSHTLLISGYRKE
jgi:DNA polymerase eta